MVELQPSKLTTRVRFPSSAFSTGTNSSFRFSFGPLAQWTERLSSKQLIEVRFLYGLFSPIGKACDETSSSPAAFLIQLIKNGDLPPFHRTAKILPATFSGSPPVFTALQGQKNFKR